MPFWLVLSLLGSICYASVNHIDKYLISRFFKAGEIGSLVLFSSLAGLPVAMLVGVFHSDVLQIAPQQALFLIFTGALFIFGIIPYFYALEKGETSTVVPFMQLVPVFSFLLGFFFLKETISTLQLAGSLLVMAGAASLSIQVNDVNRIEVRKDVVLFMLIASSLLSLNVFLFKFVALDVEFWTSVFWQFIGFFVTSQFLFVAVPSYRNHFLTVLKENKASVLSLNLLNELLADSGKIMVHYATLLVPLSLATWISEGLQPLFVLLIGILLTKLFPHIGDENLEKKSLLKKAFSIILIVSGTVLLSA